MHSRIIVFSYPYAPENVPSVLTVLNTAEAERNTQQNNKDYQGLFAATSSFMLSRSSGNTHTHVLQSVESIELYTDHNISSGMFLFFLLCSHSQLENNKERQ